MKILIYGGSFNPPHKGHVGLLRAALRQINPDYTHIFTAWQSPFKQKSAAPFEARQKMAQAAFDGLGKNIIFDDYEARQNRKTYAWQTVRHLRAKYPGAQIYLLMGADCRADLPRWRNTPYLLANATIMAGGRTKESSTSMRLQIMLSGKTADIVAQKYGLYGLNIHKWLAANLKPERYAHVKAVARRAVELAAKYGVNAEQAATAALLHDIAKSMSAQQILAYAIKNKIKVPGFKQIALHAPALLHPAVGAHMAGKIFGVKDKEILSAIAKHTLGAARMSNLDKIIFISDMAAAGRAPKEAAIVRREAAKSLQAGMIAAQQIKLIYTIQTNKWLAPQGIQLWNALLSAKN